MTDSIASPQPWSERRRWCACSASLLWLVLAPAITAAQPATKDTKMTEPSYIHWHQALSQGGSVMTAVGPDWGSVDLSANLGSEEIGYYQAPLPRERFDQLLQLMDRLKFDEEPPAPAVPIGTATLSFGKNYKGDPTAAVVHGWAIYQFPARLQPLLDALQAVTSEVRKQPVRAVRAQGTLSVREVSRAEAPAFTVTLTNVGREPIKVDNPFHRRMEEALTVRLVIRKDKPSSQLREGDVLWVECAARHVRLPDPKRAAPDARKVKLAPGEALRFVVQKELQLEPGAYLAHVRYWTSRARDDVSALGGELEVDLGRFTVKAP